MVLKNLALFFVIMFCVFSSSAQSLFAKDGVLDARSHNFQNAPLKLNGEWEFYKNELIQPFQVTNAIRTTDFPEVWADGSEQEYATYKLAVVLDKSIKDLALDIPQLYCAYSLWVNGELVAKNGVVATSRRETKPQWLPQVVAITTGVDTLHLTLQIANFHHAIGGIKNPISLGVAEEMFAKQDNAHLVNMILFGVLMFIGVFFLSIYGFAKREKAVLYFSLLCITWALRSIFSEQYLAVHWMPWFDWELALKIEYITLYLTMAWAILYISNLYPLDVNAIVKRILLYPNFLFVFLTMATPALMYTHLLNVYLIIAGALLIYVVVVILRAMLFERYGAWFSVFGVMSLSLAFAYNYLSYQGVFEFAPLTFYTLYLVFFFFLAIALAYQMSPKAGEKNYSESMSFDEVVTKS